MLSGVRLRALSGLFQSLDTARKTAVGLREEGLDVHVSGVTAYSTLGFTADPLLSTMFRDDDAYLAALIFHELAHQRVYIKDDSAFNEAFAVAVETSGVRNWLRAAGDEKGTCAATRPPARAMPIS
jgi:predicted aminopeptidase